VLGIYLGGAWVTLQGIEALVSVLGLPEWVPGFALVVLILGLPIVLATAFVQEGVGAGEAGDEAPAVAKAEPVGLHLVLTWRNVIVGAAIIFGLAGVGVAGWLLLGGEISRSPETIRSIAVLPLENLTGDPGQEYFADGMTEAVISEFARLGSLRVISRTSVMQYKGVRKPLPEIARELNVEGIVEGSVFRAGDNVRIILQLIDARDDSHLWAQSYERDLRDVLALQGEIARAVAEQIRLRLTPQEQAALTVSRAVDPRAYDAYLRGLEHRGPATYTRTWAPLAIQQFQRALELDPGFAEGWVALGWVRAEFGITGYNLRHRDQLSRAREAAYRALEIDDSLGGAHAVLGNSQFWYDWDFSEARRSYERAVQLSPSDPAALENYAWYLLLVKGEAEKALELSNRLLLVAPFDLFFRGARAKFFYYARQYENVLAEVERVRELAPEFSVIEAERAYDRLGRTEEAFRQAVAFRQTCGAPCEWELEALERGWAEGGWERSRRAWLEKATKREGFSPWRIALEYAQIGETDQAFVWLERGYHQHDPLMPMLKTPQFDPIRSDPRFDDLLRRIGFPEE
jgi:TolB-like protein